MKLETKRETIYRGMGRGNAKRYFVYLDGERMGDGETREQAEQAAMARIKDAVEYVGRASIAKVATDGTILVFRQLTDTGAMYEFCRGDGRGGSCCMGNMTDDWGNQFRTLMEYADHVITRYNEQTERRIVA